MKKEPLELLEIIAQTIYDKKGFNIFAMDVRGISSITDFILIAEGNVDKHVVAIAEAVQRELKNLGERTVHAEGMQNGDWVVLDFIEIMVHIFMPGIREKYQLERLWNDGKIIDLDIDYEKSSEAGHS